MRKNVFRGLLALIAGAGSFLALVLTTQKPHLVSVVDVTHSVAAGQPVTRQDVGTLWIKAPVPTGVLTDPQQVIGRLAQVPLYPGQTVTAGTVGQTFGGVPAGDVKILVPVTASQSALVTPGAQVDVLGVAKTAQGNAMATAIVPLALHVTVLGTYSASGSPVVTTGSTAAAPGMVALAVSPSTAQTLLPYLTQSSDYWLVLDPQGAYPGA
ncbi:SAF domain-containing protein [Sulfobacillus thermosulfidooxidans]|uniref:SAF domain-containing protein n=1 Tax=Sulfobacillus thermosulfidooxidans TaxID=28034 RepID=UPI00031EC996|nr:SAF domain-containing protein [Sulfobacillus thermosulfidooxidans]